MYRTESAGFNEYLATGHVGGGSWWTPKLVHEALAYFRCGCEGKGVLWRGGPVRYLERDKLKVVLSCTKSRKIAREFSRFRGNRTFKVIIDEPVAVYEMEYTEGDPAAREQEVLILPGPYVLTSGDEIHVEAH